MQIDEKRELETSKPADFSFKKLKLLEGELGHVSSVSQGKNCSDRTGASPRVAPRRGARARGPTQEIPHSVGLAQQQQTAQHPQRGRFRRFNLGVSGEARLARLLLQPDHGNTRGAGAPIVTAG
jgi:hypothetical protein